MSKIEDALALMAATEDMTERALMLAGLSSTLLKIKNVQPVLVGPLAYDCYAGTIHAANEVRLAIHTGAWTPLILQDVFGGQLRGEGMACDWTIAGVQVRILGEVFTAQKKLCRDFETDFGVVKLIPAEELIAERVLASFYPVENVRAKLEAKRLLSIGLVENIALDWDVLVELCQGDAYRGAGEQLALLRTQAKMEVDSLLAEAAAAEAETDGVPPQGKESVAVTPLPADRVASEARAASPPE